jgi:hypothetical protein
MGRRATDQELGNRLTSGEYVIDEQAVAEAMLERLVRGELPRSAMLISGKSLDRPPSGVGEDSAGAGPRLA